MIKRSRQTLRALVLLGLSSALAQPVVAQSDQERPGRSLDGTRLELTGVGQVMAVPDIAIVSAGVVTQGGSARAAMDTNTAQMASIIKTLAAAGIAKADIQTRQVGLQPILGGDDRNRQKIIGYQASNALTVTIRDIDRTGPVLDALVTAGANDINGPNFKLSDPEPTLNRARSAAVHNAQARAAVYAQAAGLKVKKIVSISEAHSDGPIVGRGMAMMASDTIPVETGQSAITASVTVVFELS